MSSPSTNRTHATVILAGIAYAMLSSSVVRVLAGVGAEDRGGG